MSYITRQYLIDNPDVIFVFGDNTLRKGKGGAAKLRDEPNTYGFITKKFPDNYLESFYTPFHYRPVFEKEMAKLRKKIEDNPDKTFLISKLGAGLANKYNIYEYVIEPALKKLEQEYDNVQLLF